MCPQTLSCTLYIVPNTYEKYYMPRRIKQVPHRRFEADIPCARKRRFKDEKSALAAIEQASILSQVPLLKTYRCPYCLGWHLSSID